MLVHVRVFGPYSAFLRLFLWLCGRISRHISAVYGVRTHVHLARSQAQKQPPRNGIVAVESIEQGGLRVESEIAANCHRDVPGVPDIAGTAECVSPDPKRRMVIRDSQEPTVT